MEYQINILFRLNVFLLSVWRIEICSSYYSTNDNKNNPDASYIFRKKYEIEDQYKKILCVWVKNIATRTKQASATPHEYL